MTRLKTLQAVFAEQEQREADMTFRNPWVPLFYNWVMALMLVAMAFSFVKWGIDIKISHTAEALTTEALDTYKAEQQAAADEETRQKEAAERTEEALIEAEATDCAKALYGIRLFDDKYGYSEKDFLTYLRSAFNRVDAAGCTDGVERKQKLHEVLFSGQYLACDEKNTVRTDYLEIARKAVQEWHEEGGVKPCDLTYQFAELLPAGVYLVTDPGANGYAVRWRHA